MRLRFFFAIRQNVDRDGSARNKTRQEFLTQKFDEGWIVANCGVRAGRLSDPVCFCFRRFGLLLFLGNRRVIAINSLRQLSKQYVG